MENQLAARYILLSLQRAFSHYTINFDLDDCDRILRVESQQETIEEGEIQLIMAKYGYHCEPLKD